MLNNNNFLIHFNPIIYYLFFFFLISNIYDFDFLLSVRLVCAAMSLCLHFQIFFFNLNQHLLHCSWDMNSAIRHINRNQNSNSDFIIIFLLFSIFNFQQNKWYQNAHLVRIFILIYKSKSLVEYHLSFLL